MKLHLLRKTACLAIYYDSQNDWLFLDWEGHLTLPAVQAACLEVGRCFQHHSYPRVLNSNAHVTNVSWCVAGWLGFEFMHHLPLVGIEQLAWICSPLGRSRRIVHRLVNWLSLANISLFDEMEVAVHALQQFRSQTAPSQLLPPRPAATQTKLTQEIQNLQHTVATWRLGPKPLLHFQ